MGKIFQLWSDAGSNCYLLLGGRQSLQLNQVEGQGLNPSCSDFPANKINREFLLQVRDPHKIECSSLFIIRKKTPINGVAWIAYGLFAARPYSD
jgi:hypothetical protein